MLKLPENEHLAHNSYVDKLHYQASMVESSYGVGKLKGRKEGRMYVASNLRDVLDDATIAGKTGLPRCFLPQITNNTIFKDPADRIIVATSIIENAKLVTADKKLRQSQKVATIW